MPGRMVSILARRNASARSKGDPYYQFARAVVQRDTAAHGFGERGVLKLVYAALIRDSERRRGIGINDSVKAPRPTGIAAKYRQGRSCCWCGRRLRCWQ